jgi:cytochrome c5
MFKLWVPILCAAACLSAADFPQTELSNGELHLKIYLPDQKAGFYRASRFDWAGMIYSLVYQGHEFYGPWFQRVDPGVRDFSFDGTDIVASPCTGAVGPAEEFVTDTNQPLGYEDAKPGGTFVKIGVGVLRKPDNSPYNRFHLYEIADPGKWSVRTSDNAVEFTQELSDPSSGYGYVYRKTIRLTKGSAMQIEHSLRNTGHKPIDTNVYDHNFLRIDGEAPGPDYTITTPFQMKSNRPPNQDFAEIRGNQIVYLKSLTNQDRVATPMQGFGDQASDYDVRVENKKAGVGVRIIGDRPLQNESLWSIRAVLAVEPFVHVSAAPGQEFKWTMTYSYYAVAGQQASAAPDDQGKAAFDKNCLTCHDAEQALNARRTRTQWERVVDDMVARGANGTDQELEAIIAYLAKFYGKTN